jgi:CyaY protein
VLSENDFQERAAEALEELEEMLLPVADREDFEIETGGGMMTLLFEEPVQTKFIISPNSPARQIWVSALSTSFKFQWNEDAGSFVLDKNQEPFKKVIAELISKHLGKSITL